MTSNKNKENKRDSTIEKLQYNNNELDYENHKFLFQPVLHELVFQKIDKIIDRRVKMFDFEEVTPQVNTTIPEGCGSINGLIAELEQEMEGEALRIGVFLFFTTGVIALMMRVSVPISILLMIIESVIVLKYGLKGPTTLIYNKMKDIISKIKIKL